MKIFYQLGSYSQLLTPNKTKTFNIYNSKKYDKNIFTKSPQITRTRRLNEVGGLNYIKRIWGYQTTPYCLRRKDTTEISRFGPPDKGGFFSAPMKEDF